MIAYFRDKPIEKTLERTCLDLFGKAWNAFCELPTIHPADSDEFMRAIHAAQNIVLARSGSRKMDDVLIDLEDGIYTRDQVLDILKKCDGARISVRT